MEPDYWVDIVGEVGPHLTPTEENRHLIEGVVHGFRRNALRRAIHGFVMSTDTKDRYLHEAEFHYKVDVLAQVFVAGVFNETPLTKAEQQERIRLMESLLSDLGPLLPSP